MRVVYGLLVIAAYVGFCVLLGRAMQWGLSGSRPRKEP